MIKYFSCTIIASFVLAFSGCGYKGDPVYVDSSKVQKTQNKKVNK